MILLLSRHALYLTYMARNSVVVFYSCCIMLCTSGTTCITGRCQCMRKACHYHGISLLMLDYVLDMFSIIFRLTSNIYIYYIHHATYRQLLTQFLLLFTSITYHGRSSVTLIWKSSMLIMNCFERVACLLWTVTIFTYFNIKPANQYINTVFKLELADLIYPKRITAQISDLYPVHITDYSLYFTQKGK